MKTHKKKAFIRKKNNRKPNPNLVKIGISYTAEELAKRLKVCTKTVLNWHAEGLPAIDTSKPLMFCGFVVKEFITQKNQAKKFKCKPNEFLCLKCKTKRTSVNDDLKLLKHINGKCFVLRGKCDVCGKSLRKTINNEDVQTHFANLLQTTSTLPKSDYHIPQTQSLFSFSN
jgi:hypothetical protein